MVGQGWVGQGRIYPALVPGQPGLWKNYLELRAQLSNQKIRRAALRLFGKHPDIPALTRFVFQQQGKIAVECSPKTDPRVINEIAK